MLRDWSTSEANNNSERFLPLLSRNHQRTMLQLAIPLLATATAGLAAVTWNETTAGELCCARSLTPVLDLLTCCSSEPGPAVTLKSDRITLLVDKAKGYTTKIAFDGIDLLGTVRAGLSAED